MPARIRLRADNLHTFLELRGCKTDMSKAEYLGVERSTFSRILGGQSAPGERFIAAVLHAFADTPRVTFSDLFIVSDDDSNDTQAVA